MVFRLNNLLTQKTITASPLHHSGGRIVFGLFVLGFYPCKMLQMKSLSQLVNVMHTATRRAPLTQACTRAVGRPSEVEMMCESGACSDWCSALMGIGSAKPRRRPAEERTYSWSGWDLPSRVTAPWLHRDRVHISHTGTLWGCCCCLHLWNTLSGKWLQTQGGNANAKILNGPFPQSTAFLQSFLGENIKQI